MNCSNVDLILTLKDVCNFCVETNTSLESEQFDAFVDELASRLPKFTSNEAVCALQIFGRIPMVHRPTEKRNFAELMIGLDQACTINAADWTIDQVLYVGSIWCTIPMAKKTYYSRYLGRHFNKYAKLMTTKQLAEAMCYTNTLKRPIDDIRKFENVFDANIEAMTPIELVIVCRLFYRVEKRLEKPELRKKLFAYVLERDLDEVNDFSLTNILYVSFKSPRVRDRLVLETAVRIARAGTQENSNDSLRSYPFQVVRQTVRDHEVKELVAIQRKLQKSMHKRSIHSCVEIADLGSGVQVSSNEITEYTLNRCIAEPNIFETFTHDDLESLSRIIGLMNFTSASGIENVVAEKILQELRNRVDEMPSRKFHRHLLKIQNNLAQKDICDVELLENTLRSDYRRLIYVSSKKLVSDIYTMDAYARLNLAHVYNGDLLDEEHLEKLGKYATNYFPDDQDKIPPYSQFIEKVAVCVKNVFKHFKYAHAVSHIRHADVFVGIDKATGQPIDVSHLFPPPYTGQLIYARDILVDKPNLEVYAFVPASLRTFGAETGRMMGTMKQKLQQLEFLGFNAVLVS